MDKKRFGIVVAVALTVLVFWVVANHWMLGADRFENWPSIIGAGVFLALAGAVVSLAGMMVSRAWWLGAVIAGSIISFPIIFGMSLLYLVGIGIALILWWFALSEINQELHDRRVIKVKSILARGIPKILLGFYILLSFVFYMTPASQNITRNDITGLFTQQIDQVYRAGALKNELSKLPADQRTRIQQQVSSQIVQTVQGVLEYRFCLTPQSCAPAISEILPPVYAFLFFLVLWSFGFLFRELGLLMALGIFEALRWAGFVSVAKEQAEVDVLKL